jgi:hypothetical protein
MTVYWNKLSAGEKDKLIHKIVFGVDMTGYESSKHWGTSYWIRRTGDKIESISMPPYTSDMKYAKKVIDRLDEMGYRMMLMNRYKFKNNGEWYGYGCAFYTNCKCVYAVADTAEDAIGMAALKVFGVEIID